MASAQDVEKAKRDVECLSIIGIEPSSDLTSDILIDTVNAVKSVNLDFKAWKKTIDEHKKQGVE